MSTALLRTGRLSEADIGNIAEEIESIGRSEKRELVSRLVVLLQHLLKWQCQPGLHGNSWRGSIKVQRIEIDDHLRDNPSLKSSVPAATTQAYRIARVGTKAETGLPEATFPRPCPWNFEQIMDEEFLA